MKNILGLICMVSCYFQLSSQTYGNEWIEYGQKYYSFSIVNDGIYKIDYNTLVSSGIPLSTINSNNFQVFRRERQIPIHIVDGGDNSLDNGDFIYLYAQRNDAGSGQ